MSTSSTTQAGTLVDAFSVVAVRCGDRVALRCGRREVTYAELDSWSSQWAAALRESGCAGRPVGIFLERSVEMVVAALAVVKAGGCYVPLDPAMPAGRLRLLLEDADPAVVVTSRTLADALPADAPVVHAESLSAPGPSAAVTVDEDDCAYVIFTSGTSGRPKGVRVSHANVLALFASVREVFDFGPQDVWSLVHSFGFDFSVWEMWGPLLTGGSVVVIPTETVRDPKALREALRQAGVTVLSQTPTAFAQLTAEEATWDDRLPLRWVVLGGEALRFPDLRRWTAKYSDANPGLVNMYGITEITVHATYRRVRQSDLEDSRSLIGRPLPGEDIQLLDAELRPVPDGEVGEIVVTGPGVALGYLNRPNLTHQRFVTITGPDGQTIRGYRSGDLAVLTPQGELEYRGRADDQVKIRGYRIELGEIQAVLAAVPGVEQTAVTIHQPRSANPVVKPRAVITSITHVRDLLRGGARTPEVRDAAPRIVAYVTVGDGFEPERMFTELRERLPAYMIPAFVVPVGAIPVNHNGKTDTDALPLPTAANTLRPPEHTQEPLGGQTEPDSAVGVQPDAGAVRDLFEDVLDVRGLTPDDSFFAVGGDSILALNLCAAAQARGLALELADVYALQTPRALAAAAGSGRSAPAVPAAAPFSLIGPADRALLPADGVEDAYPLAALQGGVLFHSAYGADRNMYCDVFLFRLRTEFDRLALERAIDRAVRRHDILRSSFHFSGFSEPLQLVHTSVSASVTVKDLRGLTPERQDAELEAWLDREATQPYDWSNPPLMRFTAHLLGEREWALWFGFHDALLDGWSESSLLTEILTDYWALRTDPVRPAARRLSRRFADFVALEQAAVRDEDIRQFWARELAGVEPMLLPRLAAGDPDVHRGRIGFLSVDIVPELSGDLDAVAGARGVTLKHVLLAAHARVQAALNARDEVLIGVESNGRVEEQDGSEVLGTHLNVVPYRLATRDRSWDELIDAAWAKENELLAHRRFPYAELQRLAGVPELTDILFNYTHFHTYESLAATGIEILDAKGYNRTNLTLRVEFNKDPFTRLLSLDIEANLERVTEEQLRTVGELYRNALTSLAADARAVPRQPALLGEERTHALIDDGRGPRRSATAAGWFERFDRAVAEHHDSAAAVCGAGTLSYGELAARVGSMAGWLHHRGVRRGSVVGLGSERGLGHLVTVLAVLRVGAVYLPLPAGPTQRVGSMLRRSGCDFVLCDGVWRDPITEAAVADGVPVADLTTALAEAERHESYDGPAPQGRDSAYALFTSGSTGEPKGALIRHDGMLNHIEAKIDVLSLGPGDRVSQDAAATFDISVWQWLAPLAVGATTVIYPDEIGQDPPRLLRALAEDAVTVLEVTPSVLNVMRAELEHYGVDAFPRFALRWVASQAETLTPQHANAFRRLLPGVRLLNMWGATEISDDCTHYEVRGDADERTASVPIGRPIANSAVYVLDDDRAPVPPGTPGELYAAGVCVGAGYLNDKERSAESFVPDPFSSEPGALMYRTGDRGRRLADGNLEFLGRSDNQLKIRGQRVELDEITAALAALAEVAESAVIVRENGDGGKQLVGFYVPEVAPTNTDTGAPSAPVSGPVPRLDVTPPQVRAGLAKVLPRFAVPDFLIRLDRMPRTTHGKLDTRELHRWDVSAGAGADAGAGAAASATEAAVLEVWEPILKVGTLSSSANFFEFGGHSLQATQAVARLRDRFGLDLPVRILFEQPTARDLAARIDALLAEGAGSAADDAELRIPHRAAGMAEFPLSHSQSSLWFLHQYDPDDRSYETGSLLYLSGLLDVEALRAAVAVVAERHEILSVRFGSRDGVPYQTPLPEARLRLEVEDIAVGESVLGDPGALLALAREHHRRRRFDLEKGPLAVAQLWRFSPTEHVLEWSVHHILSDGWSNVVALHEVQQAYHAHQEARPANLPALDVQYADYALWQREFLTASPRAEAELAFWRQYLDGYDGDLGLVTDMERSDDRSREAGHAGRVWDRATSERIRGFAREQGVTPFMLFHTVTAALTAKLGQRSDVVLGAAVAGRAVHGTEHLVGFFANTLPFRYHVDVSGTVADLLATVRENVLNGFEHQLAPFQEIVKSAGVPRHTGVPPLVQVFVTVDDYALDADGFPGLSVIHEQLRPVNSLFDLVFEFVDRPALELTVRYDTSLFGAVTADRLLTAFGRLLDFVVSSPERPLSDAMLSSPQDREALAAIWHEVSGSTLAFDGPAAQKLIGNEHWGEFFDRVERRGLLSALLLTL